MRVSKSSESARPGRRKLPASARKTPPPLPATLPKKMQEAINRARRAAQVLRHVQRNPNWHPQRYQSWASDLQSARAILSKAQATFEAWRREAPWATADQVVSDFNAYSDFVSEAVERFA
jgi:hypothetical protein